MWISEAAEGFLPAQAGPPSCVSAAPRSEFAPDLEARMEKGSGITQVIRRARFSGVSLVSEDEIYLQEPNQPPIPIFCKRSSLGTCRRGLYHAFQRSGERNCAITVDSEVPSKQPVKIFPFCTYFHVNILKWITFLQFINFTSRAA